MITANQLKQIWSTKPDDLVVALTKTLADFGYADLQQETVKKAIESHYADQPPEGVIAMFVSEWLTKGVAQLSYTWSLVGGLKASNKLTKQEED